MYQKHSVAVVYQELAAENQYEYAPLLYQVLLLL